MIIGLGGKIGSGKSTLANALVEMGWKRISFADPLKKLVAEMIGVRPEEINNLKNVRKLYTFGTTIAIYIAKETGLDGTMIERLLKDKTFNDVREILQYIGTDVIRRLRPDWHCQKLKERILNEPEFNYVVDDIRFPNELETIKNLGNSSVWYIDRPGNEANGHSSENSLSPKDFGGNVIVNDGTVEELFDEFKRRSNFN